MSKVFYQVPASELAAPDRFFLHILHTSILFASAEVFEMKLS